MEWIEVLKGNWLVITETLTLLGIGVRWWYVGYYQQKKEGLDSKIEIDDTLLQRMERMTERQALNLEEKAYLLNLKGECEIKIIEQQNEINKHEQLLNHLKQECDCVNNYLNQLQ